MLEVYIIRHGMENGSRAEFPPPPSLTVIKIRRFRADKRKGFIFLLNLVPPDVVVATSCDSLKSGLDKLMEGLER